MERQTLAAVVASAALVAGGVVGTAVVQGGDAGADFFAPNVASFSAFCIKGQPDEALDPIVFPGQKPTPHMHRFLGAVVDVNTTPADLIGRADGHFCPTTPNDPTTGVPIPDYSAQWFPCVYPNASRATCIGPGSTLIYYRNAGKDPGKIWPWPTRLAMVAGNGKATEPQDVTQVGFYCIAGIERTAPQPTIPSTCPVASSIDGTPYQLKMYVKFPDCVRHGASELGPNWTAPLVDGTAYDGQPGVIYAYANPDQDSPWARVCPANTLPIPQIDLEARTNLAGRFPINNNGTPADPADDYYDLTGVNLASDTAGMANGISIHADWMNGWLDEDVWRLLDACFYPVRCNAGAFGQGPG